MEKKFICSLPWQHLSVHPHGHCSPCCDVDWSSELAFAKNKKGTEYTNSVLNIKDGVEQIINSDSYKDIRLQMLDNKVPSACLTCYNIEKSGGMSKRLREEKPDIDYKSITNPDGSILPNIANLELRLGNFCNLKCRSCNAESSTSWIDDYYKLKDKVPLPSNFDRIKNSPDTYYDWVEDIELYVQMLKYSPEMRLLQISGGEPFLVDKHSHLLDLLIENDIAKQITISYITNANYNFDKVKFIFDKLTKFKQVNISISVDDIGARNTYIRSLSNFDLTIKNIKRFINEYDFYFTITQTVNVFNFLYVEELSQFLVKEGLLDLVEWSPIKFINDNYVTSPSYQSPEVLPLEVRRKKLDQIEGLVSDTFFNRLKSNYYNAEQNNSVEDFLKVTEAVDKVRKEKLSDTFPELYNILTDKEWSLI